MKDIISLNKNHIVRFLKKPASGFTREDLIHYVSENGIEMVNFMYPAADGRLKTLNFVINSLHYLETILTLGERVDGSSLFPFINAASSDLYVIPRYSTAFRDPFAPVPTMTLLCSFFNKEGQPLELSPEHTLRKACAELTRVTGLTMQAMGELEYYVITGDTGRFPASDQRGYHESAPFAKTGDFRTLCMHYIAQTGAQIKYGHSEVGNFTLDGKIYEQNEIEFLPVDAPEAADHLMLARWVIQNLAFREGYDVSFAPKICEGKAGSGLHFHIRLIRDGKNVVLDERKNVSDDARRAIAGLMELAPALTAFGNTDPSSYFRLVPHQEAPTNVCWGDRNRSVLVRVPLGWTADTDMCACVNRDTTPADVDRSMKQTFEIRSADGTANIYLFLAGLAVAIRHGFETGDALRTASDTYVDVNIHSPENSAKLASLGSLPVGCGPSACELQRTRHIFEEGGVFSPQAIDAVIAHLRSFGTK